MKRILTAAITAVMVGFLSAACAGPGWDPTAEQKAMKATTAFKQADPDMQTFFDQAHGYAIFPAVGKGGAGIGAAYGEGSVYEKGSLIGASTLTKVSLGLQLGGQSFSQIIFFKDQATLDQFKSGTYALDASASAVAVQEGAGSTTDFDKGIAIFTLPQGGLMFEATVGGQMFEYEPR